MNGVHDMGGMHGFGPMVREENEPVFHEPWEGRVYGMSRLAPRDLYPGGGRFALESLDPATYLASSYYEKWLIRLEQALVEQGYIGRGELAARIDLYRERPDAPMPRGEDPEAARRFLAENRRPQPTRRETGGVPRFKAGDRIIARNVHPPGHIRMPRYVRGRQGTIAQVYGFHPIPDTDAAGTRLYAEPQALYSVRFEARDLWGESAESKESLYVDLFESYLSPA